MDPTPNISRRLDLHVPPPARPIGHVQQARAHNRAWITSHHLLPPETSAEKYLARFAEGTMDMFPDLTGPALDLAVDLISWFVVYDDLNDTPEGVALAGELTNVLYPGRSETSPRHITGAFADLWARECADMPDSWRRHARQHWQELFDASCYEAINRYTDVYLDLKSYMQHRRTTINFTTALDFAETIDESTLADRLRHTPEFQQLTDRFLDVCGLVNDLYGLDIDDDRVDPNSNVVFVLQRQQDCDRTSAVAIAEDLLQQRADQYRAARHQIIDLGQRIDLSDLERQALNRQINTMNNIIWVTATYGPRQCRYTGVPPR